QCGECARSGADAPEAFDALLEDGQVVRRVPVVRRERRALMIRGHFKHIGFHLVPTRPRLAGEKASRGSAGRAVEARTPAASKLIHATRATTCIALAGPVSRCLRLRPRW